MSTSFLEQNRKRIEEQLHSVDDTWDGLKALLNWIQADHPLPKIKAQEWSQVIVRGETDGTMGMERVKQLLTWNPKATLIMSGGVYGREKSIGDIGAIDSYKHLEHDLALLGYPAEDIKSRVIIDSLSEHTVHQGKVLSGLLKSIEAQEVFIVIPLYHMPRFLLTLGAGLRETSIMPTIIPSPYGDWSTHHPRKGPRENPDRTYTYQELFCLPPAASLFDGKFDCGEIDKLVEQIHANEALSCEQFLSYFGIPADELKQINPTPNTKPFPLQAAI